MSTEVFEAFKTLRIAVVGDIMIDSYIEGAVDRISPESPVPVVEVRHEEHRLGGAANVALNLKKLGATPLVFSTIGNDESAVLMKKLFAGSDISTRYLLQSNERLTTRKTRVLSRGHQLLRFDHEDKKDLNPDDEKLLMTKFEEGISQEKIDAVIFQDYNKGILTGNLIHESIALCNQKGIPTAVDPKKKNFFRYSNVQLFKPNFKEVQEGFDLEKKAPTIDYLKELDQLLKERLQHRITMITLSDRGIFLSDQNEASIVPAYQVRKVSDVSGAGDTVIAVASLGLALGLKGIDIAHLANMAGGLVCEEVGVVPIDLLKLKEAYLKNINPDSNG